MPLIETVEAAERAFNARGETFRRLDPPSAFEMQRIEHPRHRRPDSLRALIAATRGIDLGGRGQISFSGEPGHTGHPDLFPNALSLGTDGLGNEMVVELSPAQDRCGPVIYVCHDPPVVVIHSADLRDFVLSLATEDWGKEMCLPSKTIREAIDDIWARDPHAVPAGDKDRLPADLPAEFIAALGERGQITDLGGGRPGDGFSWGRFGPCPREFRLAERLVFGIAAPAAPWHIRALKSFLGQRY